ncbi:MAG: glycosyltransferase family 2 protein, partial [Desulfovibrionaceae bacterium]|nr:glycosyltransferase family 2 protein [Desulfovibrionaceae bacterium]
MHFSWQDIPRQLAVPLLKGSVGRLHLVSMANLALELTHSVDTQQALHLLDIASGLLTAAWEADPLDPVVAGQLLSVQNVRPFLPQASLKLAKLFAAMPPAPENLKELHACLAARDTPVTLRYLDARRREEPHNLFWLRQG